MFQFPSLMKGAACRLLLGCLALLPFTHVTYAAAWPERPIQLVVPIGPGSYPDILARIIAPKLSEELGQTIIIDNRPGAGTNIGTAHAAKAAPDGYTLLLHSVVTTISASLYSNLTYDPRKDFAPISQLSWVPNVVVVNPSLPVKTMPELVDYGRKNPGKLRFASAGAGATTHLAGELLKMAADIDLQHVPYSQISQGFSDVMSGQIEMVIPNLPTMVGQMKAGRVRALAVTGANRSPAFPDLPTVAESGFPGFEVVSWHGLVAPAGTPPEIVSRVHQAAIKVLKDPKVAELIAQQGAVIVGSSPSEYAAYIRSETDRWAKVITKAGIRID